MGVRPKQGWPRFKAAGAGSTYQDCYVGEGYASAADFITAVAAAVPATASVDGVLLTSRELSGKRIGRPSDGKWEGTIDWRHESRSPNQDFPENTGDEKISFSFSGGPTFFTKAISQTKYGTKAIDVGKSINVTVEGEVQGQDVGISGDGFQIRTKQNLGANAAAVNAKIKALRALIHKKNDAAFRGLDAGDCLFLGFSGEQRIGGDFDMTYDFGVQIAEDYTSTPFSAGRETFTIGTTIKGFDLVWIMYDRRENTTEGIVYPQARGVYVAEVFEDGDFSTIGIAT